MARYRLRHQATDLDMPVGDFLIGRSSSCHLALDDALVSRQHAVIHVTDEGAAVEDLESRNGVTVNGEPVDGRRELRHLDRIHIGSHEMTLVDRGQLGHEHGNHQCAYCGTAVRSADARCPSCGAGLSTRSTMTGQTMEMEAPDAASIERGGAQPASLKLVAELADKALAMRKPEEADQVLRPHLDALLDEANRGEKIPDETLSTATKRVLLLASELRSHQWLDWLFRIHRATGRLLPAEDIDRLHELVRTSRYTHAGEVRAYIEVLQQKQLSAADRFLLRRLQALERVVSA